MPNLEFESNTPLIAGVDEAGRGPLAGPVIAAAVILNPNQPISGLKDSKQLSEKQREALAAIIKKEALCYAVGRAEVNEIDSINILQATLLAMQRAVNALHTQPSQVLIDGNQCPSLAYPTQAIIKGDQTVAAISAASIIAKVTRDQIMMDLDSIYPQYGFAKHKGYPTKQHRLALQQFGPTQIHRFSFAPVKNCKKK